MKKNFLFLMATAAVFAGCSNGEIVDEKEVVNPPVVVNPNGQIEVTLGSNADLSIVPSSRGVVTGWSNTPIAVWGLDKAEGANWENQSSVLMDYALGTVDGSAGNITFGTKDNILHYYYPMNSSADFSFFACSPLPNSNKRSTSDVTAVYNLSGNTDILWGKAETVGSGFNANYFRTSSSATAPQLAFEHVLTQVSFVATRAENTGSVGKTIPTYVDSVKIMAVPSSVTLTVAGANQKMLIGSSQKTNLSLYADGSITYPVLPEIGKDSNLGMIMLMPSNSYIIRVVLRTVEEGGKVVRHVSQKTVTGEFLAGIAYKIRLSVNDVYEVVFAGATLKPWGSGTAIDQVVPID